MLDEEKNERGACANVFLTLFLSFHFSFLQLFNMLRMMITFFLRLVTFCDQRNDHFYREIIRFEWRRIKWDKNHSSNSKHTCARPNGSLISWLFQLTRLLNTSRRHTCLSVDVVIMAKIETSQKRNVVKLCDKRCEFRWICDDVNYTLDAFILHVHIDCANHHCQLTTTSTSSSARSYSIKHVTKWTLDNERMQKPNEVARRANVWMRQKTGENCSETTKQKEKKTPLRRKEEEIVDMQNAGNSICATDSPRVSWNGNGVCHLTYFRINFFFVSFFRSLSSLQTTEHTKQQ